MYVKRLLEDRVLELWKAFPSVFIVGPRRAGKTTLVKKIAEETGAIYISMDDPDARRAFNEDVKLFSRSFLDRTNVIDEIQYGEDPGRKLKYLIDVEKKRFLVTGSSARAVSMDVLSFLVGRAAVVTLYPFSLEEIKIARVGEKEPTYHQWRRIVKEYVLYGGFPEVVLGEFPRQVLEEITKLLITKEVPSLERVDTIEVWEIAEALSLSQGGPLNISSLSRVTGSSFYVVKKVLNILEEAFIVKRVRPFFRKRVVKELRKAPKVYFTDSGILSATRRAYHADGYAVETAVLSELLKAGHQPYYWRTKSGAEVDFVVKLGNDIIPVEVKTAWQGNRIPRSLRSFIDTYKPRMAFIVDLEPEMWEKRIGTTVVRKIPIWLLGKILGPAWAHGPRS